MMSYHCMVCFRVALCLSNFSGETSLEKPAGFRNAEPAKQALRFCAKGAMDASAYGHPSPNPKLEIRPPPRRNLHPPLFALAARLKGRWEH